MRAHTVGCRWTSLLLEGQLGCQGQLLARLQGGRWAWLQRAIAGQAVAGLAGQGYKGASWAGIQGRARWVGLQGRARWVGLRGARWAGLQRGPGGQSNRGQLGKATGATCSWVGLQGG